MYYTIENAIGTEVNVDNKTLVCGNLYATKTKAPKDVDYILAFSKSADPVDDKVWRFDGKATLDYAEFCETVEVAKLEELAWKTEKINIQSKIRPSKDSKKALATQAKLSAIAEIEAQHAAGDIDSAEFAKLAIQIATTM